MKMLMTAVYDAATKVYSQPFYVRTRPEAIRSFSDSVNGKETSFHLHPEDYTLFCIGEYDDNLGAGQFYSSAEKLITALECVRQE